MRLRDHGERVQPDRMKICRSLHAEPSLLIDSLRRSLFFLAKYYGGMLRADYERCPLSATCSLHGFGPGELPTIFEDWKPSLLSSLKTVAWKPELLYRCDQRICEEGFVTSAPCSK